MTTESACLCLYLVMGFLSTLKQKKNVKIRWIATFSQDLRLIVLTVDSKEIRFLLAMTDDRHACHGNSSQHTENSDSSK